MCYNNVIILTGNHTYFEFKPTTVEKNSLTVSPQAGIKPTPLRCRCAGSGQWAADIQLKRASVIYACRGVKLLKESYCKVMFVEYEKEWVMEMQRPQHSRVSALHKCVVTLPSLWMGKLHWSNLIITLDANREIMIKTTITF